MIINKIANIKNNKYKTNNNIKKNKKNNNKHTNNYQSQI